MLGLRQVSGDVRHEAWSVRRRAVLQLQVSQSQSKWILSQRVFALFFCGFDILVVFFNPWQTGRGGCDFYMWQEACAEHLATLGPAAPPVAQIDQGQQEIAAPNQGCQMQAADGGVGQQNGAPEASHLASAASEAAGSSLAVAAVAQHQATIALDPASINLVVSVGK